MTTGENAATWIGAKFYTVGRESTVQLIVLHWMATTMAGADATFTGGQREASAHFGLEDAKRHQYVKKADTAWHANDHVINHKSIGIEHSAQPGRPATEATIVNSIALCTDLCREFGLTADAIHQHNDYSATQCPGTLPVTRIRDAVRANLTKGTDMPLDANDKTWLEGRMDAHDQYVLDNLKATLPALVAAKVTPVAGGGVTSADVEAAVTNVMAKVAKASTDILGKA